MKYGEIVNVNSWGLYPKINSNLIYVNSSTNLEHLFSKSGCYIPYGNGRSYGDSALSENILYCKPRNLFLNFDPESGMLHCEGGVLLSEILEVFVPRGWFLECTPGTKLITIGGAIASDVHGKNHHVAGCFSECVEEITLLFPDGQIKTCHRNDELFKATCGGMGLTGLILSATIRLKKIKSRFINQTTIKTKCLEETFEAFECNKTAPYSVAWIDCLKSGKHQGRSLLMTGDFANDGDLDYKEGIKLSIPFHFPSFSLNKLSVKAFNNIFYATYPQGASQKKVNIDQFFYPLDKIYHWNRIYGKTGFTQYQFILPKENSFKGLTEILSTINQSGKGSFLAVLKLYGPANHNFLSFPIEGYSLALDFKIEPTLFPLLEELDQLVVRYGGRIYLSKDTRVSKDIFEKGYPSIKQFREFRADHKLSRLASLQSRRLEL
jgi:FAD/FMN-containing dehydrogenase